MSQKQPKPTLTGQRIRTRKRDEKEKYDPESFRDSVISTLKELNNQSEEIIKALDKLGNTLDYHRYGDVLFDILIVGGLLSQGGKVILEDGAEISPYCIVGGPSTDEGLKEYVTVFAKIIRRYKYLQRNLGDVCVKLVKFLKCFEKEEIQKFARSLGLFIAMSLVNLEPILEALSSEHLVKEGISIEFISIVLKTWLNESKIGPVAAALKKSEFEFQLRNLLPASKRTHEALINHFANDEKLQPIAQFYKQIESHGVKSKFSKTLQQMIEREASVSKIVSVSRGFLGAGNNLLTPVELVCLIWDAGMESVEWNKKPDLLQEQALKHVKTLAKICQPFCETLKTEIALMNKIQNFCYDNMNFMKIYHRIIMVLYNAECLSEDAVLKWFESDHSPKGKTHFLKQMESMIQWLNNAEEESDSAEE